MAEPFIPNDDSATSEGAAPKPSVPCTAVRQIAQECARAILDEFVVDKQTLGAQYRAAYLHEVESTIQERLERTLDVINASSHEAGSRSS